MTRNDLLLMIDAAHALTNAAQQHEAALQELLERFDGRPEDVRDTGYAFAPISQTLNHWGNMMSAIFPTPENDPAEMASLAETMKSWGRE